MRHRKKSRRLVGKWEHRKALLRNLLVALFIHERIQTTEAKAKELRRLADKMIVLAKRGDLAARRQALSILPDKAVVRKLFSEIKDRYAYRQSGFTRIVRIGPRRGDAAMMVIIELVTDKLEHKPAAKKEAPATTPEAKEKPAAEPVEEVKETEAAEAKAAESAPAQEEKVEETPQAVETAAEEASEAKEEAITAESSETTKEAEEETSTTSQEETKEEIKEESEKKA
ncbi:50S ribosomal protein L17 [Thermodesulfatator autotrophicus]|uniref:Large ribosomal subunit protein bL17 n=1 Tax=Thermodesulfatator autotrophicus TaxID=1795632 RepID=A0A177E5N2_9BACT|nr:hypothetical protein TH606_08010 [Thermodesulfatator autotrophicus]